MTHMCGNAIVKRITLLWKGCYQTLTLMQAPQATLLTWQGKKCLLCDRGMTVIGVANHLLLGIEDCSTRGRWGLVL